MPFNVAVIVAAFTTETGNVVTLKVAVVELPATDTVVGTVAQLMLDETATDTPPVGAGPLRVNVPVEGAPPCTIGGLTLTLTMLGALIAKAAWAVVTPKVPVIVAEVEIATAFVVTVKLTELVPAATVTELGTVAEPVFDDKVTTAPLEPALPLRVTVPIEEVPPMTVVGLTVTLDSVAGVTVKFAVCVRLFSDPVITAVFVVFTAIVFTVKLAEIEPAGIVTVAGTVAQLMLDERPITVSLTGSAKLIDTVPVDVVPP